MESTRMSYRTWAIGLYLRTTNIKGISSMRLHRELGITQKPAWFMLHRLRETASPASPCFPVLWKSMRLTVGGKRKNMSNSKRKELAGTDRGPVGGAPVVGALDRKSGMVVAGAVENADRNTLQGFVVKYVDGEVAVYTDEAWSTLGFPSTMRPSSIRKMDTHDQMLHMVRGMAGKRIKYRVLTADNGIPNFTGAGK